MARKERIPIQRSGELEAIDTELDEALERLVGTNNKIASLLDSIEPPNQGEDANTYAEEGAQEGESGERTSDPTSDAVPTGTDSDTENA